MLKKIIDKIFPKANGNKRAVSPVIATILLIALTVTAAAIVYFLVVPMLQGKSELVQIGMQELSDSDGDGQFDTVSIPMMNIGTSGTTIDDSVTVIIYDSVSASIAQVIMPFPSEKLQPTAEEYLWEVTNNGNFSSQEDKTVEIESSSTETQISPLSQYEFVITYGDSELRTGRTYSSYSESSSDPETDFLSSQLVYRTSIDDASTCRSTFPTSAGYSPRLWFLIGRFEHDESGHTTNTDDYIQLNGYGTETAYRPYFGLDDEFTEGDISADTNFQLFPYNDSGQYPGLIDFVQGNFDNGDDLDYSDGGIVYLFCYIYNPTSSAMDVSLSAQSDDVVHLWVNGELKISQTDYRHNWNRWQTSVTATFQPGYNILTFKSIDNSGNWDAQTLFWDTGSTDDLTSLINVWPLSAPTSSYW
jgi:flagellin-like protein